MDEKIINIINESLLNDLGLLSTKAEMSKKLILFMDRMRQERES